MLKPFRVQKVLHGGGRRSFWIFSSRGELHREAVGVLKGYSESTQQTYAYGLADHLNWLEANHLTVASVTEDDLRRYMNALTGQGAGVFGIAWRDRPPIGGSAGCGVATIVKAFYLDSCEAHPSVVKWLSGEGKIVGHGKRVGAANALSPRRSSSRPRFLPEEFVDALFAPGVLRSERDVMVVRWLVDSGIRVGGLCGLRFSDLHLVRDHPCGQRKDPHVHIVGREDNPNGARAKAYYASRLSPEGYVLDGVIRAVSDAMITTFYSYLLDEYHPVQHLANHDQVLVHVKGRSAGRALTTGGVRKMLRSACRRAGLDRYVTPHAFRHRAAARLYSASDFNAELVAQEFGWASADQVTGLYGRSANSEAMRFLGQAWDAIPNDGRPGKQQR